MDGWMDGWGEKLSRLLSTEAQSFWSTAPFFLLWSSLFAGQVSLPRVPGPPVPQKRLLSGLQVLTQPVTKCCSPLPESSWHVRHL